jgi:5-oxoprolinase (ATP-hydrolysing) subunit A
MGMDRIDINCDMGESFGTYHLGNDEKILDFITSANIACGFHAGDPKTMRETVRLALEKKVGIGAHPGLQDLVGFGRRNMNISRTEAYDIVIYQIGALEAFVKSEGGTLQHVKPHGALYNMASENPTLARGIAEAVYKINPELILFGLAGSELIRAGEEIGLRTASEVFADRTYQQSGLLTSRREKNALIEDHEKAAQQVVRMIKEGKVSTLQGTDALIDADTVCIHGDGLHALEFTKTISKALKRAGIQVTKISDKGN